MSRKVVGAFVDASLDSYPTIGDYIQSKHPDVYKYFNQCKLTRSLKVLSSRPLTLLMPDKKMLDDIEKIYNKGAGFGKLRPILACFIIPLPLIKPADWSDNASNILTSIGSKLPVSVKGDQIECGPFTIKKFSGYNQALVEFVKASGKGPITANTAIWTVSGDISKFDPNSLPRGELKPRTVGKKTGHVIGSFDAAKLTELHKRIFSKTGPERDSEVTYTVWCALSHLMNNKDAHKSEYANARLLMCHNPYYCYYLLTDEALFDPELLIKAAEESHPHEVKTEKGKLPTFSDFMNEFMAKIKEEDDLYMEITNFRSSIKSFETADLDAKQIETYKELNDKLNKAYGTNISYEMRRNIDANAARFLLALKDSANLEAYILNEKNAPTREPLEIKQVDGSSSSFTLAIAFSMLLFNVNDFKLTTGSAEPCACFAELDNFDCTDTPDIPGLLMADGTKYCPAFVSAETRTALDRFKRITGSPYA